MCFGELTGLVGGLDVGVKERKESRMTQILVLISWVNGGSNFYMEETAGRKGQVWEKIQEFCFGHVEFEMPSRYSNGEVNTFEYINLDFWGVVRTGNKIWSQ